MRSTMPRSIAPRTSSVRLQWLRGSALCSDGCSQAKATIAQICSGVKVPGAPGRWASDSRSVAGADVAAVRQRSRQWRTVFGQTPSWRAISRTPVPAAANKISRARSASFRGVVWPRARRLSNCSSAAVSRIGSADRRGIASSTNHGMKTRFVMPCPGRFDSPRSARMQAVRHHCAPTVARQTHTNAMESQFPARGTSSLMWTVPWWQGLLLCSDD